MRILAAILASVTMTGCAGVGLAPNSSAWQQSPLTLSPQQTAFIIAIPQNVKLTQGDVRLTLAFKPDESTSYGEIAHEVFLEVNHIHAADTQFAKHHAQIYKATIPTEEEGRFQETQARIRALKAQDVEGEGIFAVGVERACYDGTLPTPFMVSSWIQTDPQGELIPLAIDVDLWTALEREPAAELRRNIQPCKVDGS